MSISTGIHDVIFWTNRDIIINIHFIGDLGFSEQGCFTSLTGVYQCFGQTYYLASALQMESICTFEMSVSTALSGVITHRNTS